MLAPKSLPTDKIVAGLLRHRVLVFVLAALVGGVSLWRTVLTYQSLRSNLEELLPKTAPSVTALEAVHDRVAGLRFLGVVVDTGGPQNLPAAERFVSDLKKRIEAYPRGQVDAVRTDISEERRFVETYAMQLMQPEEVRELRETVEAERDRQVSRGLGTDLLDEGEGDETAGGAQSSLERLRQRYEQRYSGPRYPNDRFVSEDGRTRVLLLQTGSGTRGYDGDRKLLDQVKADIASLGFPGAYAQGMRVGFAGDVATQVEELEGLAEDLGVSGVVVLTFVVSVIVMFFRSWRALPILGFPLALGTTLAFAVAALPPFSIRYLNSNTAFLASIIVGNGVNFGIILLARFAEERQRGRSLAGAIEIAVGRTWTPTLAAAVAASASYGCLVLTDFRGFNQFGWIGGIGMLTCWAATYIVGPPMMLWLGESMQQRERRGRGMAERIFSSLLARPRLVLALSAITVVLAVAGIAKRRGDYLEYDLSTLRRRDSLVSGERYWGQRMDATLKRYLTPTLIMPDTPEEASVIEGRVRKLMQQNRAGGLIGSVVTSGSILPRDSARSLEEAKRLQGVLTPRLRSQLKPDERRLAERALSPAALHPLEASELPQVLVSGLREKNGRLDRNVLVYPKLGAGTWDAQRMAAFTDDLRNAASVNGHVVPIAGSLLLSSDIASAVRVDGPRMTILALLLVLVICVVTFRSIGLSFAAVGSLLAGVVIMLGGMSWAGARLNFSNFVALPITFGIAADYSINVLKRFQADSRGSIERALASTGGAVALCSTTTVIGYGSLLVAQNQALFSFGVLAVAGELACLATAVLALPAALNARGPGSSELEAESHSPDQPAATT